MTDGTSTRMAQHHGHACMCQVPRVHSYFELYSCYESIVDEIRVCCCLFACSLFFGVVLFGSFCVENRYFRQV